VSFQLIQFAAECFDASVLDVPDPLRPSSAHACASSSWSGQESRPREERYRIRCSLPVSGKIYISYRRNDAAGIAGRIYDGLNARFPKSIFMDVSGIESGADFDKTIEKAVGACDTLIVLMGQYWLGARGPGEGRLDDPYDFVRLEIATALKQNIRVVPVLLPGGVMPTAQELPAEVAPLAHRHALAITAEDFDHDIQRLVEVIELSARADFQPTSSKVARAAIGRVARLLAAAGSGLRRLCGRPLGVNSRSTLDAVGPSGREFTKTQRGGEGAMELLETLTVRRSDGESHIRLYRGDLAAIPTEEAVDLLIVSAFPNSYTALPDSVIGALQNQGLSVAELAEDKSDDLRRTFGCWLSKPLPGPLAARLHFRRLLCFEPLYRGSPPEVVGEIFRCLMPFAWGIPPIRSVALPLIASGKMQVPASTMFEPLIKAAEQWLQRGLPLEAIKIVERDGLKADDLRRRFAALKAPAQRPSPAVSSATGAEAYDLFLSYSRQDEAEAKRVAEHIRQATPQIRVFVDRLKIKPGASWQDEIDRAILASGKVVALYSPAYLESKVCQEEFGMARVRHRKVGEVLFPIYLRSAELLPYMETIDYVDCREADLAKLDEAAAQLAKWHRTRDPNRSQP
jgi:hypothetical protein